MSNLLVRVSQESVFRHFLSSSGSSFSHSPLVHVSPVVLKQRKFYIDYMSRHRRPNSSNTGDGYHFDHGLLHYVVVFSVGLGLSWFIQQAYSDLGLDGWLGVIAQDLVLIYFFVAVLSVVWKLIVWRLREPRNGQGF